MKLSQDTIQVLKNFATINPNLVVRGGNTLQTVAVTKSIMASATVQESFPKFAIYDLSEFLGVLSLFRDPEVSFEQDHIVLSENRNRVKYMFGDTSTFKVLPPEKEITMPDAEIKFDMSWTDMQSLNKAASVLKLGEIAFTNKGTHGGSFAVKVFDAKNPLTNNFAIAIDDATYQGQFSMVMKVDNLRLLQKDVYHFELSSKRIARVTSDDNVVQYHVALEATSEVA